MVGPVTARCLATFALALGLVLMHHTVMAGPPAASTAAPVVEHGAEHAPHAAEHGEPSPAGHGDGHAGMLLHLCLAILAALGVLLLVGPGSRFPRPPDEGDDTGAARTAPTPARPPPVPLRLARLQVLRL